MNLFEKRRRGLSMKPGEDASSHNGIQIESKFNAFVTTQRLLVLHELKHPSVWFQHHDATASHGKYLIYSDSIEFCFEFSRAVFCSSIVCICTKRRRHRNFSCSNKSSDNVQERAKKVRVLTFVRWNFYCFPKLQRLIYTTRVLRLPPAPSHTIHILWHR